MVAKFDDVMGKLRPKIVEQVQQSNAFYSAMKGKVWGQSFQEVVDEQEVGMDEGNDGYATVTISGVELQPSWTHTTTNYTYTTQATGWYWPPDLLFQPQQQPQQQQPWIGEPPQPILAQPAMGPIEEPPPPAEVPAVEPKRGRMIKLGKKR